MAPRKYMRVGKERRYRRLLAEALEPRLALVAEVEPNDSLAEATLFTASSLTHTGRLSNLGDRDYFQVVLGQGDRITANYGQPSTFDPEIVGSVEILDDAGRVLSTKVTNLQAEALVPEAGTYYVRTSPRNDYGEFTGNYVLATSVAAFSGTTEAEPNNTTGTANAVSNGAYFRGSMSAVSDLDYFSFSGSSGQTVSINLTNIPAESPTVIVYRPDGTELGRGDLGLGVQLSLPVSGSYRFAISAVRSVGTFVGQYVGRMNLVTSPVTLPATAASFDTATAITLSTSSVPVVGMLTDVNVPRYLYFDVTTFNHSSISLTGLPYNLKVSLFNERGQKLEYRHSSTVNTSSVDVAFTTGRYYVSIEALSEAGLGPFQISVARSSSISSQRDVPLYFIDLTAQQPTHLGRAWVAPFNMPVASGLVQGLMESRYDAWDVDVTQTMPPAGTEHVAGGFGDFGDIGAGGYGSGGFGNRRPSGDSVSDARGSWTSLSYGRTLTLIHEFGHATGLSHARSVQGVMGYQNDDEIFPVGSGYLFPWTDSLVPSTNQNNSRDYLDWALQAGRQIIEPEPNDTPAAALNLETFLNEMRAETVAGAAIPTGTSTRPTDLRLANLNGDAWPDLVVAHDVTESFTVHLGTGLGTFAAGTSYVPGFTLDWFENMLAIGDINGDGRDDVLIMGQSSTNNVAIYIANADGTLGTPSFVTAGTFPDRIALADLNKDTRLDLITGGSSEVGVHLGSGDGTFQTRGTYNTNGSGVRDLVFADINGDTHLDVITANHFGDNVSILRGNGNGSLQAPITYAVGDGPTAVMLQELTGDSYPDLLTINYFSQTFSIVPGTGGGAFGATMSQPGLPDMYSLNKGDFNLDGKTDIVVSTNTGARFFTATTGGTLVEFSALTSTLNKAVAVADLNQDGRDDVLWSNYWNTRVDVLLSKPNDVRNDRAVVFGRIDSATDVDRYTFTAAAGQRFAIDVEAAEFQYPLDTVLSIFDSTGTLVAQSDDALDRDTGVTSVDPYLLHTFTTAGTYHAQISAKWGTVGHYRFKVTPGEAIDDDGPRIIGTLPNGMTSTKARRQVVLFVNDQIDPATLTSTNIVVQGSTSGVRSGTATFDPFESVITWTADTILPNDSYTVTLQSGATGITDLKGNRLDGEATFYAFPDVSGNGTPGGNFSFTFTVNATDTTPAAVSSSSYSRNPYSRGEFNLNFNDELSLTSVAGAVLTARGAGADTLFNTADDRVLPLDVLQDTMNHRQTIRAFTRGIPDPDRYRIEGSVRDSAGFTINLNTVINVITEVPESALFTTVDLTQTGLTGSYVNSSLRSYAAQDDWRVSQTIAGSRIDPVLDFPASSFGSRSQVGITGGSSDTNWENFSTQWDGYLQVPAAGTRLLLRSLHGSRMWIDLNNDGVFNTSGAEFLNNFWGSTGSTVGTLSSAIAAAGAYRIRVQFEHATGSSEQAILEWMTPDWGGQTNGIGHGPSVIDTSIQPGSVVTATGLDSLSVRFSGAINVATLTPANFKVRFSPDGRFYNGNDSYLTDSDGLIAWNAVEHRATFQTSQPLARGHYLLELNGDAGGITDTAGRLLDGEYLDSYIAGNALPMQWQDTPSGDGVAGGDYLAAFSISNFTATLNNPGSVSEDSPASLTFEFTRTGDLSTAATVSFGVSGSATLGSDYTQTGAATFTATAGTVSFTAGAATATVLIHATDDNVFEADETVILTLTAGAGYLVGTPVAATGTIQNDDSAMFLAQGFAATSTGVIVNFNRELNPSMLNLYDLQGNVFGAADLTLVGATNGNVRGSLVIDPNLQRLTFIATTGRLPPDNYTLTLRSAADAFQESTGQLLDGDANGIAGGNYVQTFVVNSPAANAVTVEVPNFARGPQQNVNLPANGSSGIPLSFSNGDGIMSATLELRFDPTLLTISSASVAPGLPAGAIVNLNSGTPGVAAITFSSPTPLAAGTTRFVDLQAAVPSTALYRSKQVLDIANISLNGGAIPALDDDAVHVVAYFGDVTANGTYSAQDASQVARLAVGLDGGLTPFKMLDPAIIADITGNGSFSASDTSRMLQAAVGIQTPEIPPLPQPAVSLLAGGPDPKLSIPRTLTAAAGQTLSIPVEIDSILDLTGSGLTSADLVLYFDPKVIDVSQVKLGSLMPNGWMIVSRIDPLAGRIDISLASTRPLEGKFRGELVQLQANVRANAPAGKSAINLAATSRSRWTQLNEGFLTLIPAPTDAADDPIDGLLTIKNSANVAAGPTARIVDNRLLVYGTPADDMLLIKPTVDGNQLIVRANGRILGVFDKPQSIAIDGLSGRDYVYVDPASPAALIATAPSQESPAQFDDLIFTGDNAQLADSPAIAANESMGPSELLSPHDLALLHLLDQWAGQISEGSLFGGSLRRRR